MSNPNLNGIGPDVKLAIGVVPLNRAAGETKGTAIDRLGFNSCVLEALCGAVEGTPTSFTDIVKLQHSDTTTDGDFSDYVPTVGTAVVGTLTAVNTRKRKSINLKPAKRYIRAVKTVAFVDGSSPKLNSAAVVVLGGAVETPAQADD